MEVIDINKVNEDEIQAVHVNMESLNLLEPPILLHDVPEDKTEALPEPPKKKKLTRAELKKLAKLEALEKKRAAAEYERQIIRDYLHREREYADRNKKKLEKRWKQTLMNIKTPILKKQFQYAINQAEMIFDAKDYKISLLMDEIDHANEQAGLNNRSHLATIEELLVAFRDQLDHLKCIYDEDMKKINDDENKSLGLISKRKCTNEDFLQMMIYGLDVENKHEIKNIRSEYMSKISGETTFYNLSLRQRTFYSTSVFDEMYNEYREVFDDYLEETREKTILYEKLKAQPHFDLHDTILELYDTIKHLKESHTLLIKDLGKIENDMSEERESYFNVFEIFKYRLIRDDKIDREKLIELTQKSNAAIDHLKRIKENGKKIITMMSLCGKFETQKEKVLPHPRLWSNTRNSFAHINSGQALYRLTQYLHLIKDEQGFWTKFALAETTRCRLREDLVFLRKENEMLKNRIKKICNDANCQCMFPTVYKIPIKTKPHRKIKREKN